MESDIALDAAFGYSAGGSPQANYATYTWNFGDGSPVVSGYAPGAPTCETPWLSPCAASEFHSYQYGGAYEVTLTVKDVGGNTTSVTHVVNVVGPPPPGGGSGGGTNGGSTLRVDDHHRRWLLLLVGWRLATGGTDRRGEHHLQVAANAAEGPGRPLLGERAGGGTLRGSAQPLGREQAEDRRVARRRPARWLARRRS